MKQIIILLLALLPFILLFLLIVFKKWPAIKTMSLVWIITAIISLFVWQINPLWIAASFTKGLFIALEIMLIIFSAIFLLQILKEKGQLKEIHSLLSSISPDARIQAIIIAWLFGSLIEGIAGFGTPAALAAPLLVSLGFSPFLAVILALIANSTAVSFGAAGTPINLGLGSLNFAPALLDEITKTTALFHAIAGLLIPLTLVYLVLAYSKKSNLKREFISTIPFIILAWLSFAIPYVLVAFFIGPELPSIIAGIFSLFVISSAAHYNFLTPKRVISFTHNYKKPKKYEHHHYLRALIPYGLVIILLTLSRTIPALKSYLSSIAISWKEILGLPLTHNFLPLFTPAFYFLVAAAISIIIFRATKSETKSALNKSFQRVKIPTIALIFALALVQLLLISSNNNSGLQSIPLLLANSFTGIFEKSYIFLSPFIGIFGAFIAGSNTVSNLLFGAFQAQSANSLGLSLVIILSLQVVGGAIGNMIAIHNILAASAAVGLKNQESKIIKTTILVSIIYALLVGLLAFLAISVL